MLILSSLKNLDLNKKSLIFLVFFFCLISNVSSQNGFRFLQKAKTKQRVPFRLINNLIVLPIEINGKTLSFILDTGVNKTIIFNLSKNDSLGLQNPERLFLRGLGGGEPVAAILSKNNKLKIKGLIGYNETIYVILKDFFDLSSRMGTTIHGIIGYNLLKNHIVKINYNRKFIDFYNPDFYTYNKCKKCEVLPLTFHRKKPYIDVKVQLDNVSEKFTDVKLLIDSGGNDAVWLFENSKKEILAPKLFFDDILGEGLSGVIYGKRSRIKKLKINRFEINKPTTSFLDSISTKNARKFKSRNGSIGNNILKRFIVWLDYPNKRIMLKKNGSFRKDFNYNMSGLDVIYNGKELVKEEVVVKASDTYNNASKGNSISFVTNYSYKFRPSFKIKNVVKGSPADKAGLLKDDIIVRLSGKPSYEFRLEDIVRKFQEKPNKKIRITINRNGTKKKYVFRLRKRI